MNSEQFTAIVSALETQSQRHPTRYRYKTLLLAGLGNLYVALVLLPVLVLVVVVPLLAFWFHNLIFLASQILILFLPLVWLVTNALWVRLPGPRGLKLQRQHCPKLFALLDELRQTLATPPLHRVLLNGELNASIQQTPLGPLGFVRNDLLIGLPLLQALNAAQFKAVLAHELGHLAHGHGRVSHWLYRQRLRWLRILQALEKTQAHDVLFLPFLRWFAPYFSAYAFPLARLNEYQADAEAARITSPRTLAEALTHMEIVSSYFAESYWPNVNKRADTEAQPVTPYADFAETLRRELDADTVHILLERVMSVATSPIDTHPALRDRLRALGEPPSYAPLAPDETVANWLAPHTPQIIKCLDSDWQATVNKAWRQCYQEMATRRAQLAAWATQAAAGELPVRAALDRALLTEQMGDAEEALTQLQALYARDSQEVSVCLALGSRLLMREDPEGEVLLERAIHLDANATLRVYELLRNDHAYHGREAEAQVWEQRYVARVALEQKAREERDWLWLDDRFEPHGLDTVALQAELRAIPLLRRAYLVKKQVEHLPEQPCYVLGFIVTGYCQLHRKRRVLKVLEQISLCKHLPDGTLIINLERDHTRFRRRLRRVPGAQLLP